MKPESSENWMSSFALLKNAQRYIMILVVPFAVIWLIVMAVVFAVHMPYMLLSYPVAGVASWIYRRSRKQNRKEEPERTHGEATLESTPSADSEASHA